MALASEIVMLSEPWPLQDIKWDKQDEERRFEVFNVIQARNCLNLPMFSR